MQYLIATTFEVVHYIALQTVHYKPLQEVHLSRYNQLCPSGQVVQRLADECLAGRFFPEAMLPSLTASEDDAARQHLLIPLCPKRKVCGR